MNAKDVTRTFYKILPNLKPQTKEYVNNHELITDLSKTIASDPGILEVLEELKNLQDMTETMQFEKYQDLLKTQTEERTELLKDQDSASKTVSKSDAEYFSLKQSHKDQLLEMDERHKNEKHVASTSLFEAIDQRVVQQQTLLQQAGVPEFYETNNRMQVERQMAILELLMALPKP